MINKDKINSLAALKRVDSEVGAQRTLRHRGILQVREVLNGCYGLYVVMEMGGKDLFDFVEEQQQPLAAAAAAAETGADSDTDDDDSALTPVQRGIVVSEANCRVLARNLVDAIAFCHANRIAHRDLKVALAALAKEKGEEGGPASRRDCLNFLLSVQIHKKTAGEHFARRAPWQARGRTQRPRALPGEHLNVS